MTEAEGRAWALYCKETAGTMDVKDHWEELSLKVRTLFLEKAASVENTLLERKSRYGDYGKEAGITDSLIRVLKEYEVWDHLPPIARQAIRMMFTKIARVVNGDPHYKDNWHDIQGYAKLAEERLCENDDGAGARKGTQGN